VRVEDEIQQVIHVRLLICPLPQRPGGVVWPEAGSSRGVPVAARLPDVTATWLMSPSETV
jgi:hypothetical protein